MSTNPTPCARWTPDCQGKQDYDGRLLDISTRYWPSGYQRNGKPSAKAAIRLMFGEPDENGYGDSVAWREQGFEADTEAEVKALVEVWVKDRFDEVRLLLWSAPT
jgi:hypothetical protein